MDECEPLVVGHARGGRRGARHPAVAPGGGVQPGTPSGSALVEIAWFELFKLENCMTFKLSVGRTCPFYLLEIEGLLTQGSRPGRTFGESVGGVLEMDSSDWSSGIRHHVFVTRSDTEFKDKLAFGNTFVLSLKVSQMSHEATAFKFCFQIQLTALHPGRPGLHRSQRRRLG